MNCFFNGPQIPLPTRMHHWMEVDSNHRSNLQQIYSLSPLATRESIQFNIRIFYMPASAYHLDNLKLYHIFTQIASIICDCGKSCIILQELPFLFLCRLFRRLRCALPRASAVKHNRQRHPDCPPDGPCAPDAGRAQWNGEHISEAHPEN